MFQPMVREEPLWTYSPSPPVAPGYGCFHLLPEHVVGPGFCLDRASGKAIWEGVQSPADDIVGAGEGVIVGRESRMSGPGASMFGVFGVSLQTGELLWESHYDRLGRGGLWSKVLRLIPLLFDDPVIAVRGSECVTSRGRILDVKTGNLIRYKSSKENWPVASAHEGSPSYKLFQGGPVECGAGRILRRGTPEHPTKEGSFPGGSFRLFQSERGSPLWAFDLAGTGHFTAGNYYSYRLAGGWVYMVVSNRPRRAANDGSEPKGEGDYFLWALEVETGQVRQKLRLAGMEVKDCTIEDVDDQSLLVGCGTKVMLFQRAAASA